jgi:hypothetical protein
MRLRDCQLASKPSAAPAERSRVLETRPRRIPGRKHAEDLLTSQWHSSEPQTARSASRPKRGGIAQATPEGYYPSRPITGRRNRLASEG